MHLGVTSRMEQWTQTETANDGAEAEVESADTAASSNEASGGDTVEDPISDSDVVSDVKTADEEVSS